MKFESDVSFFAISRNLSKIQKLWSILFGGKFNFLQKSIIQKSTISVSSQNISKILKHIGTQNFLNYAINIFRLIKFDWTILLIQIGDDNCCVPDELPSPLDWWLKKVFKNLRGKILTKYLKFSLNVNEFFGDCSGGRGLKICDWIAEKIFEKLKKKFTNFAPLV